MDVENLGYSAGSGTFLHRTLPKYPNSQQKLARIPQNHPKFLQKTFQNSSKKTSRIPPKPSRIPTKNPFHNSSKKPSRIPQNQPEFPKNSQNSTKTSQNSPPIEQNSQKSSPNSFRLDPNSHLCGQQHSKKNFREF